MAKPGQGKVIRAAQGVINTDNTSVQQYTTTFSPTGGAFTTAAHSHTPATYTSATTLSSIGGNG